MGVLQENLLAIRLENPETKDRAGGQHGHYASHCHETQSTKQKGREALREIRKRYKEIRGKRVDWISYNDEEGLLYVGIRFTDKT